MPSVSRLNAPVSMVMAGIVVLASLIVTMSFGAADIGLRDVAASLCNALGGDCQVAPITERIVLELRMPRALLALLCGAGLALAGAVLQTVTRNPLADPYLFGISSGASFGAVIVIAAIGAGESVVSQYGMSFGAFAGSALSVLLVISLAGSGVQIERMLLAGVAVSFMFSAGTSLVLYASSPEAAASLLFWTLGSFASASWNKLLVPGAIIVLCLLIFIAYSRPLRAVLAGDESARALGVEVNRLRVGMLLLSSLMTATLVANCGGIGFVGLMVPHIVRRFTYRRSRHLFLACAVFGGIFMLWVDVLARVLVAHSELPVGVITAAIGSLFFLIVLKRRSWLEHA